jgi:hypothetical protein
MDAIPQVVCATHARGYRLHVVFSDGLEGTVDFEQWIRGPLFEPLRDPAFFQRFFLEGGTVCWPNGADIAPEALHEHAAASPAG